MASSHKIKKLEERSGRHTYEGKYKDFQSFGSSYYGKRYTEYERDPYNQYQNFLYKRAMFGIKMYTQEEVKAMHPQKVERIKKVHSRAQRELNIWKQEKIISWTNKIFKLFSRSNVSNELITLYSKPDPKFISHISFKDLGIDKPEIINRLVERKVLPTNFNELTDEGKTKAM